MRTISEQDLKDILDKHSKFLKNEEGGQKADLRYADLRYANLRYANLRYADLSYADLRYADLSYADLRYANLRSANLRSANLSYADLRYANLIIFKFQKHYAYFTFDGALRIGCILMPISEWVLGFEEIGKKNNYTDLQIMMYGDFIKSCADKFEKGLFNAK